jgi:tetratricopeptide (TPR) repeat protein
MRYRAPGRQRLHPWVKIGLIVLLSLVMLISFPRIAVADSTGEIDNEQLDVVFDQALEATNIGDFATAETYWTQLLDQQPTNPALWSNRGNARVSQNKLEDAISDYNHAIEIAPDQPDPYLNRGVALEGLGQWKDAISDYNHVLEIDDQDPVAYNNLGNANAGLGNWESAVEDYQRAADLATDFAFARANYALALYQVDQTQEAIRTMKNLVRKYPQFADMRAALTAVLWAEGQAGEAESNWASAVGLDRRYRDLEWVTKVRRWPPKVVSALDKFLSLQPISSS